MCLRDIVNGRNQSFRCKSGDDITSHKQNRTTAEVFSITPECLGGF